MKYTVCIYVKFFTVLRRDGVKSRRNRFYPGKRKNSATSWRPPPPWVNPQQHMSHPPVIILVLTTPARARVYNTLLREERASRNSDSWLRFLFYLSPSPAQWPRSRRTTSSRFYTPILYVGWVLPNFVFLSFFGTCRWYYVLWHHARKQYDRYCWGDFMIPGVQCTCYCCRHRVWSIVLGFPKNFFTISW